MIKPVMLSMCERLYAIVGVVDGIAIYYHETHSYTYTLDLNKSLMIDTVVGALSYGLVGISPLWSSHTHLK